MSAIGAHCARDFHVSAAADWRSEQLVFARQQSLAMRQMPWESRIKPLKSWTGLLTPWAGTGLFVLAVLGLLV